MKIGSKAFASVVLSFFAQNSFAQGVDAQTKHWPWDKPSGCVDYKSRILKRKVRYCVQRSRADLPYRKGEPVIYFMHGMKGSAHSWWNDGYAESLNRLVQEDPNFPAATVVTFDTAVASFFSDARDREDGRHAYETWFTNELMPMIEAQYPVCRERVCRTLVGESMGGYGALKTALKYNGMFGAVAVNSPALTPFGVYESKDSWREYFRRHPIGATAGMFLLSIVRYIFPNQDLYERNDPTVLVARMDSNLFPAMYVDMGDKDDFGFYEGFQRFDGLLRDRRVPYVSQVFPGRGHSIFHETSAYSLGFVADYLTRANY